METGDTPRADALIETLIGGLLRLGVIVSGLLCLSGGLVYLRKFGWRPPNFTAFHGAASDFTTPGAILQNVSDPTGRGLIQLGILVLIATPVVRVALSVAVFALKRDYTYVLITLAVLAVLLGSLFGAFM